MHGPDSACSDNVLTSNTRTLWLPITLRTENASVKFIVRDWLEPSRVLWPDQTAGPWTVTVTWREQAGAAVCTGLSVDLLPGQEPQSVTATLMRGLPVASIISAARAERFAAAGRELADAYDDGQDIDATPGLIADLRAASEPWVGPRPGRPKELGTDRWREVAEVYSAALAAGKPPLVAVEKYWTISRPTASRWVKSARDARLLPETDRGRARGNGSLVNPKGASR